MTHKINPSWGSVGWEHSQSLAVLTVRERNKDRRPLTIPKQSIEKQEASVLWQTKINQCFYQKESGLFLRIKGLYT